MLSIEDAVEKFVELHWKRTDEQIRKSLIGSKILDIKIEPIKRRKHMYILTITTDAKPVVDKYNPKFKYMTNKIVLKVKL